MKNILETVSQNIEVKIKKGFDPKKYFKDRTELFVWSSFEERILEKAGKIAEAQTVNLSSYTLLKNSTDKTIEKELPEKHIFSETEVCGVVAALTEKQSKGEDGPLLTTGYSNLFYTPTFVVYVHWRSGDECWRVYACERRDYWSVDYRVFSPAIDSK